jgi:predicted HAD superfamily Cof-like phosphohydrolase
MQTTSEKVKEFTEGYTNQKCPDKPIAMTKDEVLWTIRMVMSEMDELAATVTSNDEECTALMQQALNTIDKCHNYEYNSEVKLIGAQADSMVDAEYYMHNIASKHGMNLSKLFDVIHAANMAKRDPTTKQFIRRESDGKVIKPEGWQEPDIDAEIRKQMEEGSWA